MSGLREYRGALWIGVLSAMQRPRHLVLISTGFIIAAMTLLVLLTLPAGLDKLAGDTGRNDIVVVLPTHTMDEGSDEFSAAQIRALKTIPDLAHDSSGQPLVAPQLITYAKLRRNDGSTGTMLLRGVTPEFYKLIGSSAHLSRGHLPRTGHGELIAGAGASATYVALYPGDQIKLRNQIFRVTGEFSSGGGFWSSELWMSQDVLQSLNKSPAAITSAWVRLRTPADYPSFVRALHANKNLSNVAVVRQRDFYAAQTSFLSRFVHIATISVAVVLGLGAVLAIANAITIALDARRRELAILRAIGYQQASLAWALLTEIWLVGMVCVGIVTILGFIIWNGRSIDSSTFIRAVRFEADINTEVVLLTVAYILLIGTISALTPIWRVTRAPLVGALRNL